MASSFALPNGPQSERGGRRRPTGAQLLFRESVHDLVSEPTFENVRRYLAASRLLELEVERRSAEQS